jgi:adenosylcobinamide-phosphate synthase
VVRESSARTGRGWIRRRNHAVFPSEYRLGWRQRRHFIRPAEMEPSRSVGVPSIPGVFLQNLTDGFVSPLAWYVVLGLPGIVLFKVVSTMDSMVGYKTPRYLRFGWCGARLDDLLTFIPARLTWLLLSLVSIVVPGCSAAKAFLVGWRQHAILPGPNSGWSEAATAGSIQRRLLGPIWAKGVLVTEVWLGDSGDPPAGGDSDIPRAAILIGVTGALAAAITFLLIGAETWI